LSGEIREEQLREGMTDRVRAALVLPRHALHGESLAFQHPLEGARVVLRAPLPADLSSLARG